MTQQHTIENLKKFFDLENQIDIEIPANNYYDEIIRCYFALKKSPFIVGFRDGRENCNSYAVFLYNFTNNEIANYIDYINHTIYDNLYDFEYEVNSSWSEEQINEYKTTQNLYRDNLLIKLGEKIFNFLNENKNLKNEKIDVIDIITRLIPAEKLETAFDNQFYS